MQAPLLFYLALLSYKSRSKRELAPMIAELAELLEDWESTIEA